MPKYDEISVKALFPTFKDDKEFMQFFPEKFPKDKGPPRKYFFDMLNTVHPEYLEQVLAHADEQRFAADGERQKNQTIKISQYWDEQLKAMPYLSCMRRHQIQAAAKHTNHRKEMESKEKTQKWEIEKLFDG